MRIQALINSGKLTPQDVEEIQCLGVGKNPTVGEAFMHLNENIDRMKGGFYGRDRTAKEWLTHLRAIRKVLKAGL